MAYIEQFQSLIHEGRTCNTIFGDCLKGNKVMNSKTWVKIRAIFIITFQS